MSLIQINIINQSSNPLPEYATSGSSGLDLRADLELPFTFKPFERALISTGLLIEIPEGYEAQIRPRSGLAVRHGLTVLNTPGTIDSDYRGELKILLINLSQDEQTINSGDRIAQIVIQKVEKVLWNEVIKINITKRNAGGFGHTGID